ncbi:hypothetical protein LY76DRAFT_157005 [Colletotrichum caudatum]|nr:hypothetical protein LY76DRAFT_157005 [Colletotrichum caudatum]
MVCPPPLFSVRIPWRLCWFWGHGSNGRGFLRNSSPLPALWELRTGRLGCLVGWQVLRDQVAMRLAFLRRSLKLIRGDLAPADPSGVYDVRRGDGRPGQIPRVPMYSPSCGFMRHTSIFRYYTIVRKRLPDVSGHSNTLPWRSCSNPATSRPVKLPGMADRSGWRFPSSESVGLRPSSFTSLRSKGSSPRGPG